MLLRGGHQLLRRIVQDKDHARNLKGVWGISLTGQIDKTFVTAVCDFPPRRERWTSQRVYGDHRVIIYA